MKQSFVSDSNVLDQNFYDELLYIMGLRDRKDDKGIERLPESDRQSGSLIELVYKAFDSSDYRFNDEEQKFDYSVNIVSTWVNRILFLKLLEGQLIKFNNNNNKYKFMSNENLSNFNRLNELFFGVLAKPVDQRGSLAQEYEYVPYLNSSLFEKSVTESKLEIKPSDLSDDEELPLRKRSVLLDRVAKGTKTLPTLRYLLTFLDSYAFNTDGKSVNDNERLINASVLGLIFEKINGYKDGSFYTPGFVTSFMVQKAIDRSIIDKFRAEGFKVNSIADIAEITPENREKVLSVLRDFKVVDPAVGSGHFLVSALNYLVKLRAMLRLLPAKIRMDVNIEIENDELVTVMCDDETYFTYSRGSEMRQSIQETLFKTKLDIIEHNLFGVDINQNSVNITRLRLWIELLKNSYYEEDGNLRTMPNLEMNVKAGNSVVFKYALDRNLGDVTAHTNLTVTEFKELVQKYRNTDNKVAKSEINKSIKCFKNQIINGILDKGDRTKLRNLNQQRNELQNGMLLFETKHEHAKREKQIKKLDEKIAVKEARLKEISDAPLFANSFEWRFEFPEALNVNGTFTGFDLVVANPPYIGMQGHKNIFESVAKTDFGAKWSHGKIDFSYYFIHLAINLLNKNGSLAFITTNYWLTATDGAFLRNDLISRTHLTDLLNFKELKIFSSALGQHNVITFGTKADYSGEVRTLVTSETGSANSDIFKRIVEGKNSNTDYGLVPQIDLQDQSTGYFVLDSASRDKSLADLIIKLQNKKTLLSYAEKPKLGLTTGSNKIFIWEKAAVEAISMTDYERSLFKPLINGSSLTTVTEKDLPDSYVMYIDHAVDEKKIPNLLKWIKSQPAYEKLMKRRKGISGRIRSFELWRPREQWIFESKSTIYFQKREITPRFTLNTQGYYLKDDSYAITLNQTYRGYEKYTNVILAVLNSTITHFWLVKLGRKKGKVLELYPQVLVTIPMPNVELIKETDIIELDDAINSGRLLDVADRFAVKWFDLEMEDISIMNKYILDNQ
ncbi:Eco57I restriction-modification methylase domain-containing protein [Loigolactobacillus coryniformis]|uniref:type IIG restriction enzyme/methyltransferase n=1 Tax=Loigolactobacillus coryniformis TaxID=1610 RepID=UPI0023405610|nr:Eco57I restriction-modification methylase domain-containing protein [Loigolactobacillus coryniformis]